MRRRRTYLKAVVASTVGLIAGCQGDSNEPAATTAITQTGEEPIPTTTEDNTATTTETPTVRTTTLTPTPAPTATPQTQVQQVKLVAPEDREAFGSSVAVSDNGETAIVGARFDDVPHSKFAGSAYVFKASGGTWRQQAKLAAADADKYDNFGSSVAVSSDGSTVIVGADRDENPNGEKGGSAYVFKTSGGWHQRAKLAAAPGNAEDRFGWSVALSDDGSTAIIGSKNGESAHVFDVSDGWHQRTKFAASDDFPETGFGEAVALSGDGSTAIVGAPYADDSGLAYVFETSGGTWRRRAKLTAAPGNAENAFGWSVALSGDGSTAIVGAFSRPNDNAVGSVYVFEMSGGNWYRRAKLVADDGDDGDDFGGAVAVSGDGSTVIVGAKNDEDPNGKDAGSVYIFETSGGNWRQWAKLAADNGDTHDIFGEAVAVSGDGSTVIVGAENDEDPNGFHAGSAYVFDI